MPSVSWQGRKYYQTPKGYYLRRDNKKTVYLHRDVWISHHGSIPDGCVIHHKDGNPLNNRVENLECIYRGEHTKMHFQRQCLICQRCRKVFFKKFLNPKKTSKFCSWSCSNLQKRIDYYFGNHSNT